MTEEFVDGLKLYMKKPHVVRNLYNLLIIVTGAFVFYSFGFQNYSLPNNYFIGILWLVIILLLPVPNKAKMTIYPFHNDEKSI